MKLTSADLKKLTQIKANHHDYATFLAYAPDLLKDLAATTLFYDTPVQNYGILPLEETNESGEQDPNEIIGPAANWPNKTPEFIAEYLHQQCERERITAEEVLLTGMLLRYMDVKKIDDHNTQLKLMGVLRNQRAATLFDLFNFEPQIHVGYSDSARSILLKTLLHIQKLFAANAKELKAVETALSTIRSKRSRVLTPAESTEDETNTIFDLEAKRQILYSTKFFLDAIINKFNVEFGLFINKLNTDPQFDPNNVKIKNIVSFLLKYPFSKYLKLESQAYLFHILIYLISRTFDEKAQNQVMLLAIDILRSANAIEVKASLLQTMADLLPNSSKLRFSELLQADLQKNLRLYNTKTRRAIYDHGFAFHDSKHLDMQCKRLIKSLHTAEHNSQAGFDSAAPLVTAETLNLIWNSKDIGFIDLNPEIIKTLACINFEQPNRHNSKDALIKFKSTVAHLSGLTYTNNRERILHADGSPKEIAARPKEIAAFIKSAVAAKTPWFASSEVVRFSLTGIRNCNSSLFEDGNFFMCIRFNRTIDKYEFYNPNKCVGTLTFANTNEGLDELAEYILNECERLKEPAIGKSMLRAVRFTQYSGYSIRPVIFNRRALTPLNLHTPNFEQASSPMVKAHSMQELKGSLEQLISGPATISISPPPPASLVEAVEKGEAVQLVRSRSSSACIGADEEINSQPQTPSGLPLLYPKLPRKLF